MFCKKCGKELNQDQMICENCGVKVENSLYDSQNQISQESVIGENALQQSKKMAQVYKNEQKKSGLIKFLCIIGAIVIGFVLLFMLAFGLLSLGTEKLICKSSEGSITLNYDKSGIRGYTAVGMSYDLDGQQEYAKKVGIDAYLSEFSDWFSENTSGECTFDKK